MKAFKVNQEDIIELLKAAIIAALIAVPSWFALPEVYNFVAYKVYDRYMSSHCPEVIPDAKLFKTLRETDSPKADELVRKGKIDLRSIMECEKEAGKVFQYIFAFILLLVLALLAYIIWFGFSSKNSIVNAGLVSGALISFFALFDVYSHYFHHSRAPWFVSLALCLICVIALMNMYHSTQDRISELKKNILLYFCRETIIMISLVIVIVAIAFMLDAKILGSYAYRHIYDPIQCRNQFVFSVITTIILYSIGWWLNSATLAFGFLAAGTVYLISKLMMIFKVLNKPFTYLHYYGGNKLQTAGGIAFIVLVTTVLYFFKKRFKK